MRTSFELGGKSAAIVLDDADVGHVLQSLVPYSMPITGQVCFSLTRVLVPEVRKHELLDAYVGAVKHVKVGDPQDPATQMGPLAMKRQLERVQGYIGEGQSRRRQARARRRPAERASTAAISSSPRYSATSIRSMTIAREEIFGPVVSFITLQGHRRRVQEGQRHDLRIARRGLYAERRARLRGRAAHALGQRHRQRHDRRSEDAVRRLQAIRYRTRGRHRRARAVFRAENHLLRVVEQSTAAT